MSEKHHDASLIFAAGLLPGDAAVARRGAQRDEIHEAFASVQDQDLELSAIGL